MYCPQCRKNCDNFRRDCPDCGSKLSPGRLGEAAQTPNGRRRRISLKPEPEKKEEAPVPIDPGFRASHNPLAMRELSAQVASEGLPGQEMLELLEFTLQEVRDAVEVTNTKVDAELEDADAGTRIKVLNQLRVVRRDLEKRIMVRMDIARLQFEELAQKESPSVVDTLGKHCRTLEKQIADALEGLTARLDQ